MNKTILITLLFAAIAILSFTNCQVPAQGGPEEIHYDGDHYTSFYMSSPGSYEAAIRLTPVKLAPFAGKYIQKIKFYLVKLPTALTANVYNAGTYNTPGSLLTTTALDVSKLNANAWNEASLPISPSAGSSDLWLSLAITPSVNTDTIIGIDKGPSFTDGDFIYAGSSWVHMTGPYVNGNLNIRGVTD
jgi:hypothetical protein